MIKTIIFDIGNVLVTFRYAIYVKKLLKDDDVIEKVTAACRDTGYWNELDLGHDQDLVFSKMLAAGPGYEKEIHQVIDNVGQGFTKMDYAKPWISEVKEKGYQVLYLSNYSEFFMNARPDVLDFLPLMDGGIFSCYVGMMKPNPAIYQMLCDKYNLNPAECIFIDDSLENIQAAKELGFEVIHFENYEQAKKELDRRI